MARKSKAATPQDTRATKAPDAERFAQNMGKAAELMQEAAKLLLSHPAAVNFGYTDPLALAQTFLSVARHASINPQAVFEQQLALAADHHALWHRMSERLLGKPYAPYIDAAPKDRRFKDAAWSESVLFDFVKQSYLINAQWAERMLGSVQGLDAHTTRKITFFARQFIDMMSPSNFLFLNPEVMRTTLESNGDNLVKGMRNLLHDLERGQGKLKISMTDEQAFTLGENIASTPGKVVFQNALMQLIQYSPTTERVHEVPLLMIPAWINKYYVLDLTEGNSLVRWLVAQGYTVFMISWVNPDEQLGRKRFDDYLRDGPLKALEVIEAITRCPRISLMGYCLGGTLSAILLSYLRAHGQEGRVASVTYLTTMLDFAEAGDLSVFIDDVQLDALEDRMSERGYLDAYDMATTFNMLRANDLIWSFVVNNYLLGKDPFPFDLLYWNSDSTRMPATMHSFYLRNMYQENLLAKPGGIELLGTPINISKITTPSYILSTKEDHIAPWKSTYAATQIFDGPVQFVLAESGHIAGVVNPPTKKKYGYFLSPVLPAKPDDWLASAHEVRDSWWSHWDTWQRNYAGKLVKARTPGNATYKPKENAPGSYVKVK